MAGYAATTFWALPWSDLAGLSDMFVTHALPHLGLGPRSQCTLFAS